MTRRRRLTTGLLAACVAAAALPSLAAAAAPTDPQAASQQPLQIMRVGEALDLIARPLADVPVLVADTGLDLSNPDIQPRLFSLPAATEVVNPDNGRTSTVAAGAAGWDFLGGAAPGGALTPDRDPHDPEGGSGHGTAVAGLLGAAWNNGQGGAGVAPNARFVALRTCWDADQCYQYVQSAAVDWAADRGARVASFSWLSGPLEDGLRASIVNHPNTLFVTIPSGNGGAYDADGDDPQPCGLDASNVLCVSTSAPDDALDCGAYGPRSVDVAVPTQNSITTNNGVVLGNPAFAPTACATSFAAPTAAGVATILFGIDPSASAADVRNAIVDSARPAAAWQGKSTSGGIVDAAAAVSLFQQRRGIAPAAPRTGGGGGGGGTPPVTVRPPTLVPRAPVRPRDLVRPKITRLTSVARGRYLRFALSEPARVKIVFERRLQGRRPKGGSCTKAHRTGRRCSYWVREGTWAPATRWGRTGRRLDLTRLAEGRGRMLPKGIYRARVVATDAAGHRSLAAGTGFTLSS